MGKRYTNEQLIGGNKIRNEYGKININSGNLSDDLDSLFEVVYVKDFGAIGDYTTDDTAAIQSAINSISNGEVHFLSGTYGVSTPILLPDNITLVGDNINNCSIKALATFTGTGVIKSDNFDTLTNTNAWFVSEGVNVGFGLKSLKIDGNSLNVYGCQLFGKGYFIDELKIVDCNSGGLFTECGDQTGQTTADDMPEAIISGLYTRNCDGIGVTYRGPHDGYLTNIYINGNFGTSSQGVVFEKSAGIYNGLADLGDMHIYAVQENGVKTNVSLRGNSIICEAVKNTSFDFQSTYNQISKLIAYGDVWDAASTVMTLNGNQNVFPSVMLRSTAGVAVTLLNANGNDNIINGHVIGDDFTTGIILNGRGNAVDMTVIDNSSGVELNSSANFKDNNLSLNIRGCATPLTINAGNIENNIITLSGYDNTNSVVGSFSEYCDVRGNLVIGGVSARSRYGTILTDAIDLTSIVEQEITVPVNLLYAPNITKVNIEITAVDDGRFEVAYARAKSWSATSLVIVVKLATAAPIASNGTLIVNIAV